MDRFYQLGRGESMLSKQQIIQKVGVFSGLNYHYNQVKNLFGKLQRACNIFRPLTQFESLVKPEGEKQLSEVYFMLLSLSNMEDGVKRRWEMAIDGGISE